MRHPILQITDNTELFAVDRGAYWDRMRRYPAVVLVNGWCYYITRRADVLAALRNPALSAYREPFAGCPVEMVPISATGAEHARYRRILQPFFSPRALGELPLREQAVALVDAVAGQGQCDVMADIAVPYPCQVLLTLLGYLYETALSDERPGILSRLLAGDELDEDEVIGFAYLLAVAGIETVTAAIGFALLELTRNPQLRARLREDPEFELEDGFSPDIVATLGAVKLDSLPLRWGA